MRAFRLSNSERRRHGNWAGLPTVLLATVVMSLGALAACLPAMAAPTFTNVTAAVGVTHTHTVAGSLAYMSAGVAAGDFDRDGLTDLFFTQLNSPAVLYRNTGSGFMDVSAAAGFTQVLPASGVASGDIDNDGDLDLIMMGTNSQRHYLFINDGGGHFTEDGIARGADVSVPAANQTRFGQGVAFGDFDGDGFLDIMTSDYNRSTATNGSRLLRNLGTANPGHFEDVTHATGLDVYRQGLHYPDTAYRFQPSFSDIDRDGHVDILLVSDERTSQLFWNNGDGTFTDGTVPAGVGTDKSGMGSALGDYDRDGDLDWFITAIYDGFSSTGNRFYRNDGSRKFTDVTSAAGVRSSGVGAEQSWGWGTTLLDYDNDADLDLMSTNGCYTSCGGSNDYLFDHTSLRRNNGNGTFTDVSFASGITDTGQGRGLIQVDFDNDGDLDVVIANYAAAPIVYRNDGGNQRNWLRVETEGTLSNRDGIGAFIKVTPDTDQPQSLQVWEIRSGDSYLSQSEMTAHFGLGDFTGTIDLVEVEWPASGILQRYVNVPVNITLRARERLLGDFNGDAHVDAADYTLWRNCEGLTGDDLAADAAGALGLPDGVVDQLDYWYWKANFGLSYFAGGRARGGLATVPEPAGCMGWLTAVLMIAERINCSRRARNIGLPTSSRSTGAGA